MFRFVFFLVVVTFLLLYGISPSFDNAKKRDNSTFRAAVYEYQRFTNLTDDQLGVKQINLRSYAKAIQTASHNGAEIIVFPESGLFSASNRLTASLNYEYIPDANQSITPCIDWDQESSPSSTIVYTLSCMARGFKIYVAAILGEKIDCSLLNDPDCPEDGHYLYNTQILFDSTGKLIAKYHKTHLFFEPTNNIPKVPEIVTVSTPLGKFGFLICFDIHFEQPALSLINDEAVDTILFGAHWIDELPFLNAHRVQSGFTIEHNVNLLASGINDLVKGAIGSGIYVAGEGPIVYTADIKKSGSRLLIADIPKSRKNSNKEESETESRFIKVIEHLDEPDEASTYVPWELALDIFNHTVLTHQSDNIVSCTETVCCELSYSLTKPSFTTTYYLLAKRWIRPTTKICEQFCGLVAYNETDYAYTTSDQFSFVKLTGTFAGNLSIPSVVTNNFELVSKSKWDYVHKDNVASISIEKLDQSLVGVTLYSRYEKDDQQV